MADSHQSNKPQQERFGYKTQANREHSRVNMCLTYAQATAGLIQRQTRHITGVMIRLVRK